MLAFLWSCVILTIKVAIGSLTISLGLFLIGGFIGTIIFLLLQLMSKSKSKYERL
jgi:hypothetical protein